MWSTASCLSPRRNTYSLEVAKWRAIKAAIWRRSGRGKASVLSLMLGSDYFKRRGSSSVVILLLFKLRGVDAPSCLLGFSSSSGFHPPTPLTLDDSRVARVSSCPATEPTPHFPLPSRFFKELEERHQQNIVIDDISDIVSKHAQSNFEPYVTYCSNEVYQQRTLQRLV